MPSLVGSEMCIRDRCYFPLGWKALLQVLPCREQNSSISPPEILHIVRKPLSTTKYFYYYRYYFRHPPAAAAAALTGSPSSVAAAAAVNVFSASLRLHRRFPFGWSKIPSSRRCRSAPHPLFAPRFCPGPCGHRSRSQGCRHRTEGWSGHCRLQKKIK